MMLTNTTDHTLATTNLVVTGDYLIFGTSNSAFNPGGSNVGISIDDATTEGARFSSSVTGRAVGDSHSCSIGIFGESGHIFSPTTCGVPSPDSSESQFYFDLSTIAPHQSVTIPYAMSIICDFFIPPTQDNGGDPEHQQGGSGVPEPSAVLAMLSGLLALRVASKKQA
jgi:hypothetical protein